MTLSSSSSCRNGFCDIGGKVSSIPSASSCHVGAGLLSVFFFFLTRWGFFVKESSSADNVLVELSS
jgi:hypothetical protein